MNPIRYFLILVLSGVFFIASLSYRFVLRSEIATATVSHHLQEQLSRTEWSRLRYDLRVKHETALNATSSPTPLNSFDTSQEGPEVDTKAPNNFQGLHECTWYNKRRSLAVTPYFLTTVLLVRIYYTDLAGLTSRELVQWLHYLKYAGVDHLYVYDAYAFANESQSRILAPYVQEGYVTYVDWSHRAVPYSIEGTQVAAYQDCITRWGNNSTWQAAIDIDEYPFSPTDQKPGFMSKFVRSFSEQHPDVSEITMQNYLFLGKPLDDKVQPFLIGRLWRRTRQRGNYLVKPVYKPARVKAANVHHNALGRGRTLDAPDEQFRMNHYWGARLQNWGEDTPEIINITEEDRSMDAILREITHCMRPDFIRQWN